jgi:hypothetical protein
MPNAEVDRRVEQVVGYLLLGGDRRPSSGGIGTPAQALERPW